MVLRIFACLVFVILPIRAFAAECLAVAGNEPRIVPAALAENQVGIRYVGHSTFVIESPSGIRIATDFAGDAGGIVPDAVTMNRAHPSHYTPFPDPAIKYVLRGWNPEGGPARHDLVVDDVRIRNVTTDIRGGPMGRIPDGNSIFIFEVAGLCIGHLGHLQHELTPDLLGMIGRLDIVMVPVDGGYTMAQVNMIQVLKDLKPQLVIPMHYFGPATLQRFLTNAGSAFKVEHINSREIVVGQDTLPKEPSVWILGD